MLSSSQMILGGLMLIVVAFLLRRSFTKSKTSRQRDPMSEARREIHVAESSYAAKINQMEVRLHDYAREVEGRIGTKIALLNRLLAEADEKLQRLEELGEKSGQTETSSSSGAVPESHRVIYDLADAGLDIEQIASQVGETAQQIRLILKTRHGSENRGVA